MLPNMRYFIFFCRFVFNFKLFKSYISPRSEKTYGKFKKQIIKKNIKIFWFPIPKPDFGCTLV